MIRFLRTVVLIASTIVGDAAVARPEVDSAIFIMPGCRAFLAETRPSRVDQWKQILCSGVVGAIAYAGSRICSPPDESNAQTVRVVVKYIDERPQRHHESFKKLALEALQANFPCKN